MLYSETFSSQWDSLVNAFVSETQGYTPEMMTQKRVNEWYKANSFRWSSIAEKEGILLSSMKNGRLTSELTQTIAKFHFSEIKSSVKPNIIPGIVAGVLGAVSGGIILKLALHAKIWMLVIEAIVCVIAVLFWYASKLDQHTKTENERFHKGYAQQLIDYKTVLMSVCKQYD